jgi:GTPase SAR1 family protein
MGFTVRDSLDLMGSSVKVLLQAIKDLSHYGIDYEVPLPKIVVVGDQSAGKSSLIEAIS